MAPFYFAMCMCTMNQVGGNEMAVTPVIITMQILQKRWIRPRAATGMKKGGFFLVKCTFLIWWEIRPCLRIATYRLCRPPPSFPVESLANPSSKLIKNANECRQLNANISNGYDPEPGYTPAVDTSRGADLRRACSKLGQSVPQAPPCQC